MRLLLLLVAFPLLVAGASAQSVGEFEMPDPPEGFTWQILPEIKAAFLLPNGWHYRAEDRSGTQAYFLTQQDIATDGAFTTGLSINAVKDLPERANMSAVQYAEAHAGLVPEMPGAEVQRTWGGVQGPLHSFGVRYRSSRPDGSAVVLHQVNVGNEETGTLYVLLFEAPEAEWETAWESGERVMSFYMLDIGV